LLPIHVGIRLDQYGNTSKPPPPECARPGHSYVHFQKRLTNPLPAPAPATPTIHQSINPSIHQSTNPSIHQSTNPPAPLVTRHLINMSKNPPEHRTWIPVPVSHAPLNHIPRKP